GALMLEKIVERDANGLITRTIERILTPSEEYGVAAYRQLELKATPIPGGRAVITIDVPSPSLDSLNLERVHEAFGARLKADTPLGRQTGWDGVDVIVRRVNTQ